MMQCTNLISFEPIEQCDTDDGCFDAGVVRERGECQRLHLDIDDACLVQPLQVLHLVSFGEIAERAVESTLPCQATRQKLIR